MSIFRQIGRLMLGLVTVMTVTSCQQETEPGEVTRRPVKQRQDIELTRSGQEIVNSHSSFAFDFFHKLNETEKTETGNMIISPLSLSLDLSMFANGVDDSFYAKILDFMHLDPSTTRDELNDLSQQLVRELIDVDSQVILKVANSVWFHPDFNVKESFADQVMAKYNAPCRPVKFWEKESEDIINGWISDATDGMIKGMHEAKEEDRYTLTHLYNALYFDGEWVYSFDSDKTTKDDFTNIDGKKKKVSMMHGKTAAKNLHDDDRSVLVLPFGNCAYNMYFILPDKGQNFEANIASFDYEKLSEYKKHFYNGTVDLSIPHIELDTNIDMTETLGEMGLKDTSLHGIPMGNMFEESVYLGDLRINQSCAFKIAEVGVKAAAVTQIQGIYLTSVGPVQIESFHIDRPFMFLIEECSTGTILFMGKVTTL